MEATFEGGQGPEEAVVPWMDGWMEITRPQISEYCNLKTIAAFFSIL
jgi:hypothetical protein